MNVFHAITGPISVNTWGVPLDSRRVMIVDPGGAVEKIIAYVEAQEAELAVILCTHGHLDHLLALPALARRFPEAGIAIHSLDAHFLGSGAIDLHRDFFKALGAFEIIEPYLEELPAASCILEDGVTIAGSSWEIIHTPGHSPGSICAYNPREGILLSGDTLFSNGCGRTDAPGGSWPDLEASLTRLKTLPPETKVLPGHGPTTTIGRES